MSQATVSPGFASVNPIATLVPPVDNPQQPQQQDVANAAHELVAQFAIPESTQARTRTIFNMSKHLTCDMFDAAMKAALKEAADIDSKTGWKAPEGVTGRKAYGPRQSSLATLASQCRQVFGAFKIDPEFLIPENHQGNPDLFPNWSQAYMVASHWLRETKKCDWTGQPLEGKKAAAAHANMEKADHAVMTALQKAHPKAMGESLAAYNARVAPLVADFEAAHKKATIAEAAEKEYKKLSEKYGADTGAILQAMLAMIPAVSVPATV